MHGLQILLEGSSRDPRLDYKLYRLSVATSDVPHSGTDGDLYVNLVSSGGSSGWRKVSSGGQVRSAVGALAAAAWEYSLAVQPLACTFRLYSCSLTRFRQG